MSITIDHGTFEAKPWDRTIDGRATFKVDLLNEGNDRSCILELRIVDGSVAARFESTGETIESFPVFVPSGGRAVSHETRLECVAGTQAAAFEVRVTVRLKGVKQDSSATLLDVDAYTCA